MGKVYLCLLILIRSWTFLASACPQGHRSRQNNIQEGKTGESTQNYLANQEEWLTGIAGRCLAGTCPH